MVRLARLCPLGVLFRRHSSGPVHPVRLVAQVAPAVPAASEVVPRTETAVDSATGRGVEARGDEEVRATVHLSERAAFAQNAG